jgi:tetratricopeptide (TPR) repeat protein
MDSQFYKLFLIGATAFVAIGLWAVPASAQSVQRAFDICRTSKDAEEKVRYCSIVIEHASDRRDLERLYLRRGNSFNELGRYDDAVADFSNLIRINPPLGSSHHLRPLLAQIPILYAPVRH